MPTLQRLVAVVIAGAACAAQAHDYTLGSIVIHHPYARATAPGQANGGGYLKFENKGADDKLLSATAAVSETAELHVMRMDGDVMRMKQVEAIDLPAGQTVELKPGGLHLMFFGLKAPLKAGERFPLTLKFAKAGETTVQVLVEAPGAAPGMKPDMKH